MALSVYAVADGYDEIEDNLDVLDPQPALPDFIDSAELEFYGDSHAEFNGVDSAILVWSALDATGRAAVLSQLGLSDSVASNEITINLKLNDGTWDIVNAVAVLLRKGRRRPYGLDDLRVLLNYIEAV
jgi:hypothetical protein